MFIGSFVATPWQSNCYLIAAKEQGLCVVVDPGIGSMPILEQVTKERDLIPAGVVLTHGHIDHSGDAAKVCDYFDCDVWLHSADHEMLVRPLAGLSADAEPLVKQLCGGLELPRPKKLKSLADKQHLSIAEIEIDVLSAPGHTGGSCLLASRQGTKPGPVFTGDVIFAGSIGRMDMPGGSMRQMGQTLTEVLPLIADDIPLLPGHGQSTSMEHEKQNNPYLQPNLIAQLMEENL